MINYDNMTDSEINKLVAKRQGYFYSSPSCTSIFEGEGGDLYLLKGNGWGKTVNYCNNPSDAFPIIVEHRISILPWKEPLWHSYSLNCKLRYPHKNPLRAAMTLYLMMGEEVL